MKVLKFEQYVNLRKLIMQDCIDPIGQGKGKRGSYDIYNSLTICQRTFDNNSNNKSIEHIIKAEVNLWWDSTIDDVSTVEYLYSNDEFVLDAYKTLQLNRLAGNNNSRNNIIQNPTCCLSQWQYIDNKLFVYSRSLDLKTAGYTDVYGVNEIANKLGAEFWILTIAQPHIYHDVSKIMRRE